MFMRVPPDVMRSMRLILPTRRDVRLWWDAPNKHFRWLTPHEQYLVDEEPVMNLIQNYLDEKVSS